MRYIEKRHELPENFLDQYSLVSPKMRKVLVHWMVQLQIRFNLNQETLSLGVWILDRSLVCLNQYINSKNFQLLGACSLFIAAKFEEIYLPAADELAYVADNCFSKRDLLRMEHQVSF